MRIPRIFQNQSLHAESVLQLDRDASHYVKQVLRMQPGQSLVIFNGEEGEYDAQIIESVGKVVKVQLQHCQVRVVESPLKIILAQAISRGEKMDFTLQKAVELGVHAIVPLMTERVGVKLDADRAANRLVHWQKVVISACEQSGRTYVPQVAPITHLTQWLTRAAGELKILLDPHGATSFDFATPVQEVSLLIGAEGGLSTRECELAYQAGFIGWHLGPRILRTETAGLSAIAVLQHRWGDL